MSVTPDHLVVVALNHVLVTEPWAKQRLLPFADQIARIHASTLVISLQITSEGTFRVCNYLNQHPSVKIELSVNTLANFVIGDLAAAFSSVRISGSADFAEALAFVFKNIKWDFEGDLATLIGNIPAIRGIQLFKSYVQFQKSAALNFSLNLKEFLTDEVSLILTPHEVNSFTAAVDLLRDDLARLDKRISRL